MSEGKTSRSQSNNKNLAARCRLWKGSGEIERIPPREQRVNLEPPRQRKNLLEGACLDLRNIDRLLLLINAGFHAVVANAMTRCGT